nr:TadE/TadG family type IV pilus assembly protein [uncultured Devosia sp.]
MRTRSASFVRDDHGVSAVEFALIVPVILLLLIGMVDINEALTVYRKMRQISSTVTDLVAQRSEVTPAEVTMTLAGSASLLAPYDTTDLDIVLSVVNVAQAGQTVAWSRAYQATAETAGTTPKFPVPAKLAENGVQVVAVRVDYKFDTLSSGLLKGILGRSGYVMQDTMYERPRVGDKVVLD